MKRSAVLFLLAVLCSASAASAPPAAAVISLESRTYLPLRGTDGGDTHAPLYEYLAFDADELGTPGLYLRIGGWGRADLADETLDRTTNGELQYAFVGWRAPVLNAEGRAGRIALTAGVARNEVFDGLLLGSDLPAGFDVTLFGGIPAETEDGGRSRDSLYGARISQGRAGLYRIGASWLKEENGGDEAREEAGVDLFLAPLARVEVTGSSLYNAIDEDWARHDYRLELGPFAGRVRLVATWASTDYGLFFKSPLNPAFSPDSAEKLDRIGGEVALTLGRGFTLTGEYISYSYDIAGAAQAFGGRLDWAGSGATAGAGYRQVNGDTEENRYREYRVSATKAFGSLHAAAGAEHVVYDAAINGETSSTTGTLGLGLALSRSLELSVSADYGATPEFEREVRGLLAVLWRYDAPTKKGGTK